MYVFRTYTFGCKHMKMNVWAEEKNVMFYNDNFWWTIQEKHKRMWGDGCDPYKKQIAAAFVQF